MAAEGEGNPAVMHPAPNPTAGPADRRHDGHEAGLTRVSSPDKLVYHKPGKTFPSKITGLGAGDPEQPKMSGRGRF